MDVFVMPSLYEGLPIAALEAQANGLPIIISDTITKEVGISNYMYLSLNDRAEIWANEIIKSANKGRCKSGGELIAKEGFDISKEAKKLENFYINL